jgi:hypothetical protein
MSTIEPAPRPSEPVQESRPEPLRVLLRRTLLPRDGIVRAILAIVVSRSLVIWLASRFGRGEPIEVTAIYRPSGDVQYFEILAALSRGNLGESNLYETAGQGLHPFPVAGMALHALCFAVLGAWGMLVADVIGTYAYHCTLTFLGRVSRLPERLSAALGGFVSTSLYVVLWPITSRLGWGKSLMWGDRLPRPFMTETFLLACIAAVMVLWLRAEEKRGWRFWVLTAIAFTLTVQSDIYGAFIAALALGVVIVRSYVVAPAVRGGLRRGVLLAGAVIALTTWPFAIQRMGVSAELLQRWGAYPVPRGVALGWITKIQPSGPLVVGLAGAALFMLLRRRHADPIARAGLRVTALWVGLTTGAALSMPLFFGILGQGLYPYMFPDRVQRLAMYAVCFIALYLLWALGHRLQQRVKTGAAIALMAAMAGGIGARAWENAKRSDHERRSLYDYNALGSARDELVGLTRKLAEQAAGGAVVLATVDQAVHADWQLFRSGRSFLPDTFVSLANDAEYERRLILFGRLIGMSSDEFLEFIQRPTINMLFLGASKYAADRLHALEPMSEYSPDQVRRIEKRDIYDSFGIEMPRNQLARLRAEYERAAWREGESPRLDVVVLTNDPPFAHHAPPPEKFVLVYENRIYRLYTKR